jgi:hypothetical protein
MEFVVVQKRYEPGSGDLPPGCRTHMEEPFMPSPAWMPRAGQPIGEALSAYGLTLLTQ